MIVRLINIFFDRKRKPNRLPLSCQTDKMPLSYASSKNYKILSFNLVNLSLIKEWLYSMKTVNKSANRQNHQKPYLLR